MAHGQRGSAVMLAAVLVALALLSQPVTAARRASRFGKLRKPIPDSLRYLNHQPAPLLTQAQLPEHFDWCEQDMCVPSWNQHLPHYCGSCFLHGTLSMVQDRLKILKKGRAPDVMLGRQTFLNCAPQLGYSDGCDGGDVIDVVRYLAKYGLPDEGCMPYRALDNRALGLKKGQQCSARQACMNCMPDPKDDTKDDCWPIKTPVIYKVSAYGNVGATKPDAGNELAMMSEIFARGPITCSISCPDAFVNKYDGGVFHDKTNDTDVDHDIEVVGWGVDDDGTKFWRIRNSWGNYWGKNSFARIVRGINAQQIEAGDCWYAVPTYDVEQAVEDGELIGSMYGLKPRKHAMEQLGQGDQTILPAAA